MKTQVLLAKKLRPETGSKREEVKAQVQELRTPRWVMWPCGQTSVLHTTLTAIDFSGNLVGVGRTNPFP